jgi:hypothetical protein
MLMDLIPQSKGTIWQSELKRKTQQLLLTGDPSHRQKQALA